MIKFFIIIINFNNQRDINFCLQSLIKTYSKINIIIVDNNSTDKSVGEIKKIKNIKHIKIIRNKRNLGFAGGCNVGIKYALNQGAESILLLNPDTVVKRGFLEPLLVNKADIVGPIIKFKRKGQWVYDFGGKVNFCLGRTKHSESLKPGAHFSQPDYLSGCCLLIKKKVFEKIGLLNEKYFLFFEDADFCLRAKKAGFKIALEPKSTVIHKLSEGKEKTPRHYYHLIRSNLIFINYWVPFYFRPIAYLYLLALSFKMLLNRL